MYSYAFVGQAIRMRICQPMFINYTTHIAASYKTIFFAEQGNYTYRYTLEPIPLSTTY